MASVLIAPVADLVKDAMDKIWPDPAERDKHAIELATLTQAGVFKQIDADLQESLAQLEVNKVEAANPSLFVSGARPALMWLCVVSLGYSWVVYPSAIFIAKLAGAHIDFPSIDIVSQIAFAGSLCGMRSFDRFKGVAREQQVTEMPSYNPTPQDAKGKVVQFKKAA